MERGDTLIKYRVKGQVRLRVGMISLLPFKMQKVMDLKVCCFFLFFLLLSFPFLSFFPPFTNLRVVAAQLTSALRATSAGL